MSPNLSGVIAIVMWASGALLLALARQVPPLQLLAMSWFMGACFLGGYYIFKGENLIAHFKRPLSDYLFVGSGICVYTVLIFWAFYIVPPFEAHILNYLWPVLLMLFLGCFQKVPLGMLKLAGLALGFAGCVMLFAYRYNSAGFGGISIGHVMALSAAIIWALYSCFAKGRSYPTAFMVPIFFVSSLLCGIGHFLIEQTVVPDVKSTIVVLLIGMTRISYAFWDYAMRHGDRVMINSLSYLVPLFSTIFMIAGGFGTSRPVIGLAAVLIISGCLIANVRDIIALFRRVLRVPA